MQEAVPAFVVGPGLAQAWSCGCTVLPITSAAFAAAFLSFSGTPLFMLVNMSTSYFRRYQGAMHEAGRFFDPAPTLPCLERRDPQYQPQQQFCSHERRRRISAWTPA
jgi:hypothetical protein